MAREGTTGSYPYDWNLKYRFHIFGGEIMQRKITLGIDKNPLIQQLAKVIDALVACDWPHTMDAESAAQIRTQYSKNVCKALVAENLKHHSLKEMFLPYKDEVFYGIHRAAFAAIGNTQMLLNYVRTVQDIIAPTASFPSALNASVYTNQIERVQTIIVWLLGAVEELWEPDNKPVLRSISNALVDAFVIAALHHHDAIVQLILDVFTKRADLAVLVNYGNVNRLYVSCVKNGNLTFFLAVLGWMENGHIPAATESAPPALLSSRELSLAVRSGTRTFFRSLIRSKKINLNVLVPSEEHKGALRTPLLYMISHYWYEPAEILLEEGVDVDAVIPGTSYSAYWIMRAWKLASAQWFLINHGADTRVMSKHGTPRDSEERVKPHIYDVFGKKWKFNEFELELEPGGYPNKPDGKYWYL